MQDGDSKSLVRHPRPTPSFSFGVVASTRLCCISPGGDGCVDDDCIQTSWSLRSLSLLPLPLLLRTSAVDVDKQDDEPTDRDVLSAAAPDADSSTTGDCSPAAADAAVSCMALESEDGQYRPSCPAPADDDDDFGCCVK